MSCFVTVRMQAAHGPWSFLAGASFIAAGLPGMGLSCRPGCIPVSLLPARLRRNPVPRVTCVRARARFAAARSIAPARARGGRRAPGAPSGAVSWNVMFCHGPYAGGAWAMVVSGRRVVHCRRPPRHGPFLSARLHSGLPAAGPPAAEPCSARNVRARPCAFRGGAPDCACARARGADARPLGEPLRRCVMACHVLSRSVCRRRMGHGRFWQARRSLPPASPAWVFPLDPVAFRPPRCGTLFRA